MIDVFCSECGKKLGVNEQMGWNDGFIAGNIVIKNNMYIYCKKCGEPCWIDPQDWMLTEID